MGLLYIRDMLFNKTTAYLIDTENVGSTFISLLKEDNEKKELYIFVTENAKNLSFPMLHELTDKRIKLHIIDCEIGKNSLDFYLSTYLGYLIGKNAHSDYVVVSQDNGFDHVLDYWTKQGISVKRIDTKPVPSRTRRAPYKKRTYTARPKRTYTSKPTKEALLKNCLADYSDEQIKDLKKVLDEVTSKQSQDVYVTLVKQYKQDEGLKIYNAVKNTLKKYYSSSENEISQEEPKSDE